MNMENQNRKGHLSKTRSKGSFRLESANIKTNNNVDDILVVAAGFLFAMYIVCGVGVGGCAPIFYELCCENTYPIAEGVTVGLVSWLTSAVSLIFLLILMIFPGTLWMNWTLVGSIAVCIPIILFHRDNYTRLDVDEPASDED